MTKQPKIVDLSCSFIDFQFQIIYIFFCILQHTEQLETRRAALEKVVKEQEPPTDSSEEVMFCM